MSHNFRLLAVGLTVVLCLIEAPVSSFTLSRPINFTHDDQNSEESINLEIINDVRRPNGIKLTKEDVLVPTSEIQFKDFNFITTIQDLASDSSMDTKQNVELSTQNIETIVNKTTIPVTNYENTESNRISNVPIQTKTNQTPSWKNYTNINSKIVNNEVTVGYQTEDMLTDETGVPRQDSKSGDIPSLNQIKTFLFPSSFFKSDFQNDTTTLGVIEQSLPNSPEATIESTTSKSGSATVESKRGGFLDFSLKSLFEDNSDKKDNSQENNTSKPKGRRLSWRFGSRYRGKEDNSGEKSKERTRYRFKNNKDRKTDNNDTKESKEEYSRDVESREDSDKKSTKVIDKDNNRENNQNELENKTKVDDKKDTKQVSNSKEILTERKDYGIVEESKNEENSSKELITSIGSTTTDTDIIWKTNSGEEKHKYEKTQRKNMENYRNHDIKENKSTNSRERSKENYSENKGRDDSQYRHHTKDYRSRARNDKDSKEINNERRKDKNSHRKAKEFDSQNREDRQRYHNELKTDGKYLNNSENPSNKEYNEGQLSQYTKITTTESNEKSEIEYITTDKVDIKSVKPEKNNSEKQVTIEFIKQYLSTIDEEEENETLSPIIEETTSTKPIEVPYTVADKHSSNFKLNNVDATTEPLDSYKPFNIPNLLVSLPKPKNKGEALETRLPNESSNAPHKQSSVFTFEDKLKYGTVEKTPKFDITEKQKYVTEIINTSNEPKYGSRNKDVKHTEALVQKHEDDRREELLKEEMINNYEENLGKFKDESISTTQTTIPVKIYEINLKTEDEKLSVKPLSFLEKFKTTILYPVSANYKPLKKLEVQSPKPFVRDPDDNSWRNESLSSLGIVFKPKNSSKSFTQVLKNKTETEWNNLMERQNKNETPDLRERLEKITEIRKSKKKKIDAYGNVVYEENSSEETKESESSTSATKTTAASTTTLPFTPPSTVPTIIEPGMLNNSKINIKPTTEKSKKVFSGAEYYDTSEEDDADYLTLAKIDLKKFTMPIKTDAYVTPPTWFVTNARHENINNYDRKPTLQYFPPLTTQKGMYRDFNTDFNQKMGAYTDTEPPTDVLPVSYSKPSTSIPNDMKEHMFTPNSRSYYDKTTTRLIEYEKPGYMTPPPISPDAKEGYTVVTDDGSYNRAADVIKHYRDFLNAVAKDHQEDINEGYSPYAKPQTQGVTVSEIIDKIKPKPEIVEHYDYENDFRKDVLQRFVHNFNQNSERFKSDLPMLYNNSIIHGNPGEGRDVASSRAYLSRMLTRPAGDCDNNATVELSPAYELHYYVPEEEEKQQVDQKSATLSYQYRL